MREWLMPFGKPKHQLKWVMQDVSFTVNPGEAVGIIGINGAGKSTLLKMITGTTQPTTGSVNITGRVAALLELGMGFHPDFTGRQNAYMAGQLLGMSAAEISHLMPEIEAFADIGDYIDQPVRVYSSGMQMRLAFSVATAHRPDVLIVDEALSVGDAYFQHKSFDRIREFRKQGTTLLIVSHDYMAIQSICDRAILLAFGGLAKEGSPEEVMDFYNALIAEREKSTIIQTRTQEHRVQTISGTGEVVFEIIELLNDRDEPIDVFSVGDLVSLRVKLQVHEPVVRLILGFVIKDRLGQPIYGTNTQRMEMPLLDIHVGEAVEYKITFRANLGPGSYSVTLALTGSDTHLENNFDWRDLAVLFNVVNRNHPYFVGCAWLKPIITISR